jgi:hypothetical protein
MEQLAVSAKQLRDVMETVHGIEGQLQECVSQRGVAQQSLKECEVARKRPCTNLRARPFTERGRGAGNSRRGGSSSRTATWSRTTTVP